MKNTAPAKPLLLARDFGLDLHTPDGIQPVLRQVDLDILSGETLVILGESGSGKTMLARGLTRLHRPDLRIATHGSVMFDGVSLLNAPADTLAGIRKRRIRYVFQDPLPALNPVLRIHKQLEYATGIQSSDELSVHLGKVGITQPEEILKAFPHQLSGGMAQRVMVLMALLVSPDLLIADEPTSALDTAQRFEMLDLLCKRNGRQEMAILLITHDTEIARRYADRIMVLYAGRVVEVADSRSFFERPLHPYSRLLCGAFSGTAAEDDGIIEPPDSAGAVSGCNFSPRCPIGQDQCTTTTPVLELVEGGRAVRCFFWK